ncbi:MAG: RHS repeat-associated core domain-containing protein [Nitrospira sp.]
MASYVYDALSRRIATTLSNGTQTTYSYDPASQVTQILHQLTASSSQINKADYLYNGVGNRTSLTDRRGPQTFGYDPLDRLTSASHPLLATPQSFAYDPVGNRTTNNSTVNAGNQLTADATHAYQYDDNGNLTRKTLLATGNYTQYTYDAENRLTKVEDFAAGNATPAFTSTYRYDGLGRRIEKIANGQTKRYIYVGDDILLEYDGSNVLQARYNHGPGIDEPIAVTKAGSTFFYHQDALGSVTDLTDSAGVTAKSYAYDAYGNILDSPGTVEQPFTYTGREFDAESGLYYYRARNYDPMTGRFLQADPFGIAAGVNLYSYVNNDPLNLIDPSGLSPVGWIVKLGDKCMKKVKALFSDEEMRQARKQGENVLVNGTRQKAHQVENGASNGSTIVKHSGHDFGGGARGRPHFQTPGRSGHTFWSGAAAAIGSLIDPFDASATAGREDDMIIPACDKCEVED